jgi:hypothetical protein
MYQLTIPIPSRLSSAELPVIGAPKQSMPIGGANPFYLQCFEFTESKTQNSQQFLKVKNRKSQLMHGESLFSQNRGLTVSKIPSNKNS